MGELIRTRREIYKDLKGDPRVFEDDLRAAQKFMNAPDAPFFESNHFILIQDIHKVKEPLLNLEKKIYLLNLEPQCQTSTRNFQLLFDSLAALGMRQLLPDLFKRLRQRDPMFAKHFFFGENWTDLETFFFCFDQIKAYTGDQNPRYFENISLLGGLHNVATYIEVFKRNENIGIPLKRYLADMLENWLVKITKVQDIFGLADTRSRVLNYDFIFQHVTTRQIETTQKARHFETLFISKYFENFKQVMRWDHEWWVYGCFRTLSAKKNKPFANMVTDYFGDKLDHVLETDYAYAGLDVTHTDSEDGVLLVNGRPVARDVLLKKKPIHCTASFTVKQLSHAFAKHRTIFDPSPIELTEYSQREIQEMLLTNEYCRVKRVEETLYDAGNLPIIKNGEVFGAPYSLTRLKYSDQTMSNPDMILFTESSGMENADKIRIEQENLSANLRQKLIELRQTSEAERFHRKKAEDLLDKEKKARKTAKAAHEKLISQIEREKKLERIMSGGFAHEMRNALAGAQLELNALEDYNTTGRSATDRSGTIALELFKTIDQLAEAYQIPKEEISRAIVPGLKELSDLNKALALSLDGIRKDIDRGLEVTQKIREYAKLNDVRPGKTPINLPDLFSELHRKYQPECLDHDINFTLSSEPKAVVIADELHLYSIFNNLILNAIDALREWEGEEKKIEVLLERCPEDKGIMVKIMDNGPGIKAEIQPQIFDPFFSTKPSTGTGLGLGMVKKLIELYEAYIGLESEVDIGTTFTVTFPETTNERI